MQYRDITDPRYQIPVLADIGTVQRRLLVNCYCRCQTGLASASGSTSSDPWQPFCSTAAVPKSAVFLQFWDWVKGNREKG